MLMMLQKDHTERDTDLGRKGRDRERIQNEAWRPSLQVSPDADVRHWSEEALNPTANINA